MGTSNTKRWFVCDSSSLSYYRREEGSVYGAVVLSNITAFRSTNDKREFKILACVPITRTGYSEITCRASSELARYQSPLPHTHAHTHAPIRISHPFVAGRQSP